jgi:hypothetical protein
MRMKARTIAAAIVAAVLFAGTGHAQQQKTIKDPAEYNAYILALNMTDPAQKAVAMEDFVKKFPRSVVKLDAFEQAMAAYQQAGNTAKVEAIAAQVVALDHGNVHGLAVLATIERVRATQNDAAALAAMRTHAADGLKALATSAKPEGMSDADSAKLRAQMAAIFNGASGFAALQDKDYVKARDFYAAAIMAGPNDLQNVYQLGIAELQMSPLDPNGFWHIARALNIANAQRNTAAAQSIEKYGKAKYKSYHGSEDGWDNIVAAAQQDMPAKGFAGSIKAAPSPAEIAVIAVRDNDPATLSFSDYEYVLGYRDASPANKEAADKVWATIQAKQRNGAAKLKIPVTVIKAEAASLDVAITDDNAHGGIADMRVTLAKPPTTLPVAGATVYVVGVIADYSPKPFLFIMKDAEVAPAK